MSERFTTFKYIDPDTNEHYHTILEPYDELSDGKWDYDTNEKIIEVKIKRNDNYLF